MRRYHRWAPLRGARRGGGFALGLGLGAEQALGRAESEGLPSGPPWDEGSLAPPHPPSLPASVWAVGGRGGRALA